MTLTPSGLKTTNNNNRVKAKKRPKLPSSPKCSPIKNVSNKHKGKKTQKTNDSQRSIQDIENRIRWNVDSLFGVINSTTKFIEVSKKLDIPTRTSKTFTNKLKVARKAITTIYDECSFLFRSYNKETDRPLINECMLVTIKDLEDALEQLGLDKDYSVKENEALTRLEGMANTVLILGELIKKDRSGSTRNLFEDAKSKYLTYKKFLEKNPNLLKSHDIVEKLGKMVDGFIELLDVMDTDFYSTLNLSDVDQALVQAGNPGDQVDMEHEVEHIAIALNRDEEMAEDLFQEYKMQVLHSFKDQSKIVNVDESESKDDPGESRNDPEDPEDPGVSGLASAQGNVTFQDDDHWLFSGDPNYRDNLVPVFVPRSVDISGMLSVHTYKIDGRKYLLFQCVCNRYYGSLVMAEQHSYECEHANFNNFDHDDVAEDLTNDPLTTLSSQRSIIHDDAIELTVEDDFESAIMSPQKSSSKSSPKTSPLKPNPRSSSVKDNTNMEVDDNNKDDEDPAKENPEKEKEIEVITIDSSSQDSEIFLQTSQGTTRREVSGIPPKRAVQNNDEQIIVRDNDEQIVLRELHEDERQTMLSLDDARHKLALDRATKVFEEVDEQDVRNIINSKVIARKSLDPTDLRHGLANRRRNARLLRNRILSMIKVTANFTKDGEDAETCNTMQEDLNKLKVEIRNEIEQRVTGGTIQGPMPPGWILDNRQDAYETHELEQIADVLETYIGLLVHKAKSIKENREREIEIQKFKESLEEMGEPMTTTTDNAGLDDLIRHGDLRDKLNRMRATKSKTSDPSKIKSSRRSMSNPNPPRGSSSRMLEQLKRTVETIDHIQDSSDEELNSALKDAIANSIITAAKAQEQQRNTGEGPSTSSRSTTRITGIPMEISSQSRLSVPSRASIFSKSTVPMDSMKSPKSTSTKRRSSRDDTIPDLETDDDRKCRRLMEKFKDTKINPIDKRSGESWKSNHNEERSDWKKIPIDQIFRDQARFESSRSTSSYHEQVSERGIYRNRGYDWDLNRIDDVEPEFRLDFVTRGPSKPYLTTIINERGITVHRLYNQEARDRGSCQVITQWAFDNIISGRPIRDLSWNYPQQGHHYHRAYGFRNQYHEDLERQYQASMLEQIIQRDNNHREMRNIPPQRNFRRGSRYTWYRSDQDRRQGRNRGQDGGWRNNHDEYPFRNQRK